MKSQETAQSLSQVLNWVNNNFSRATVFRGQSDSTWELESRIARREDATRIEKKLLREFIRLSRPHLEYTPANNLEWLAVAQHHGMATRLLDWTSSPLAGLWFAVRNYQRKKAPARLWAFSPDTSSSPDDIDACFEDPFTYPSVAFVHPPHISARITAQSGCFTLQPVDPSTGTFLRMTALSNLVDSIILPPGCLEELTKDLDRCGINELTMFPSLDAVARHVEWKLDA